MRAGPAATPGPRCVMDKAVNIRWCARTNTSGL